MGKPWRGIITQANVQLPATEPGPGEECPTPRFFEGFSWRPTPFTLRAVFEDTYGHMAARPVGRVDRVWADGDDVWAEGIFSDVLDGQNAETLTAEEILNSVSVDPSDYAMVEEWIDPATGEVVPRETLREMDKALYAAWEDEDEDAAVEIMAAMEALYLRLRFRRYEIGGATLTAIQAVTRAKIFIVEAAADVEEEGADAEAEGETLQASALPADDLAALAAATPVIDGRLVGPRVPDRGRRSYAADLAGRFAALGASRTPALQASGGPARRPAAAYARQALDGPTPFGISDDGWFTGHLTVFEDDEGRPNCHRSLSGPTCVVPPRQEDFTEFHAGSTALDDGTTIRTGVITFADLHAAPGGLSVGEIQRLIEDTGVQLGSVRLYADRWGYQASGHVHGDLDPEEIARALAAAPSGDWRMVAGTYRLFGAHLVNTPGLITREGISADGSRVLLASMAQPPRPGILPAASADHGDCGCGGHDEGSCSCGSAGLSAADLADLAALDLAQARRRGRVLR